MEGAGKGYGSQAPSEPGAFEIISCFQNGSEVPVKCNERLCMTGTHQLQLADCLRADVHGGVRSLRLVR